MATLDWPALPAFKPTRFALGVRTPKSRFAGFYSAQSQTISHMADRLRVDLTLPPCTLQQAGDREALLMQLASAGDTVRMGHLLRPVPLGDFRGAPVLVADAAAGARSVSVIKAACAGNFLSEAQAFGAASWSLINTPIVTSNVTMRPNSDLVLADQIEDDSVGLTEGIEQIFSIADDDATYTASIYVKATSGGTSKTFAMEVLLTGGTTVTANLRVNTDTGAVLSGPGEVASIDGGTWWRISRQVSNNGTGNTAAQYRIFPARGAHDSGTADSAQTGAAIVWGAQFEPGASVSNLAQPDVNGGDVLSIGGQLAVVAYEGAVLRTASTFVIPLAVPLRRPVTNGGAVVWYQPTGTFELLSDVSQFEYLPGRFQNSITLSFQEVL